MKLIWWHHYTTEAQDELLEEMDEDILDDIHEMLQSVAENAYAHGLKDGKENG